MECEQMVVPATCRTVAQRKGLLFVRKYRKIEFHKNMHSPWKQEVSTGTVTLLRDVCVCVFHPSHVVHVKCNTEGCCGVYIC